MKNYYSKLSRKKFKTITILFMAFGDLVLCRWLWMRFIENPRIGQFIELAIKKIEETGQLATNALPADYFEQILMLMKKSLLIMFGAIIIVHAINYYGYWKDKSISFYYLRLIAWTGSVGAFFVGVSSLSLGVIGYAILLLSFMYMYVALGFLYHPAQEIVRE
jgi:hypothetical protein